MIEWVAAVAIVALGSQAPGATLSGVVRDARTGEAVGGAMVTLPDAGRSATSEADGAYVLRAVPAGLQHLEVRRIGYATRTLHAFVPSGGRLQIHLSIEPDPVRLDGITAAADVPLRGAESAAAGGMGADVRLTAVAVVNHPTLAEPDVLAGLSGGAVAMDPEMPRGLHVRGGRADQVAYLLDGFPVLSPLHSTGLFSAWNPDAIATVELAADPASAVAPEALSGVVTGRTRVPGRILRMQGAAGTSQVRATVDGPLAGAGFLLSVRHGFAGFPAPQDEYSYVRGQGDDWLAKLEVPVGGGVLLLESYGNRNRVGAPSALVDGDDAAGTLRHRFRWAGETVGAGWSRDLGPSRRLRVRAWHATADAAALWVSDEADPLRLDARERDAGAAASLELDHAGAATTLGLRVARTRAAYLATGGAGERGIDADALRAAVSVAHERALGSTLRVQAAVVGTVDDRTPRLAPRLAVRWTPAEALSMAVSLARSHQTAQSLSNEESLAGYLFPPLPAVPTDGGPVARSDRVSWVAEVRPAPGARVAAEAYAREFRGIALVGPGTDGPFATGPVELGSGTATGGSLEVSVARARYLLLGSWGYDRVRFRTAEGTYVPVWSAAHRAELGVLAFPLSTLSLRLSATGGFGRRATAVLGRFEWEACNVLDMGCEFAGTPDRRAEPLGGTRLPAYLRLDAGARKHWHVRVAGMTAQVGVHATITNVLGRTNLLTRILDPDTGEWTWVEMRSRVPLAVGIDWRF